MKQSNNLSSNFNDFLFLFFLRYNKFYILYIDVYVLDGFCEIHPGIDAALLFRISASMQHRICLNAF